MLILLSGIRHFGQILERRSCYGQKHFQSWVCSLDMFYTGMTHFFYYLILQSVIGRVNLLVLVLVTRVIFLRVLGYSGFFFNFECIYLSIRVNFRVKLKLGVSIMPKLKTRNAATKCYKKQQEIFYYSEVQLYNTYYVGSHNQQMLGKWMLFIFKNCSYCYSLI